MKQLQANSEKGVESNKVASGEKGGSEPNTPKKKKLKSTGKISTMDCKEQMAAVVAATELNCTKPASLNINKIIANINHEAAMAKTYENSTNSADFIIQMNLPNKTQKQRVVAPRRNSKKTDSADSISKDNNYKNNKSNEGSCQSAALDAHTGLNFIFKKKLWRIYYELKPKSNLLIS